MNDLLRALKILSKYLDVCFEENPTQCEDGKLIVLVDPTRVPRCTISKLKGLGFYPDLDKQVFFSEKYGGY